MVRLASAAVRYRCLGPCGETYPNYQRVLNHRRGPGAACKGAGHEVEVSEAAMREAYPAPQEDAGGAEEEAGGEGEGDGKGADRGLPTKEPPTAAAGPNGSPVPFTVVEPSTTKDTIWMPSAAHTLYDTIRGSERFRYDGSFQDLVIETFFDYWAMLGVKVAVIVTEPKVAEDGHQPKEEKAHA